MKLGVETPPAKGVNLYRRILLRCRGASSAWRGRAPMARLASIRLARQRKRWAETGANLE